MAKDIESYTSDEELRRSHDYSDELRFPSAGLVDTIHYWRAQQEAAANPAYAERAGTIIARAEFELTMRGETTPAVLDNIAQAR
jgi:hypothetical protein